MSKQHNDDMNCGPVKTNDTSISIGKIKKNVQVTTKDTGWTEEEKERMKKFGYDGVDMVKAWYG